MNRRGVAMSESEADDESGGMADSSELIQTKRQLRILEKDYYAYKEQSKNTIKKQEDELSVLEREKSELQLDLSNTSDRKHTAKDDRQIGQLQSYDQKVSDIRNQVKEEQEKQKNLDAEISAMKEKVRNQKRMSAGSNSVATKHHQSNKKRTVLEGRLDKKLKVFNKLLSQNKDLREEIDHLRREKNGFDDLYKQLVKKLESIKREMQDVIQQATVAYEQRDEAQNKMAALQDKSEKDTISHETEMKDLRRQIHHDEKIKEFMLVKSDDRAELKSEETSKREAMRDGKAINAELALIQQYQQAFARITEVTGEEDIGLIIENFQKDETENFALFNYVNELNSEIETLNDQITAVNAEMEAFEQEEMEDIGKHKEQLLTMETKLSEMAKETENCNQQLVMVNKSLDQLRSGIESLFMKIGCDPKPIYEMLGGEEGINNKNIMTYLGLIEQKTTTFLTVKYFMQLKSAETEGKPPPTPPEAVTAPQTPKRMSIVPPGIGETEEVEESDEEEELIPMSENELRSRVHQTVEKKHVSLVQQAATKSSTKDRRKHTASKSPSPSKKGTAVKS